MSIISKIDWVKHISHTEKNSIDIGLDTSPSHYIPWRFTRFADVATHSAQSNT